MSFSEWKRKSRTTFSRLYYPEHPAYDEVVMACESAYRAGRKDARELANYNYAILLRAAELSKLETERKYLKIIDELCDSAYKAAYKAAEQDIQQRGLEAAS